MQSKTIIISNEEGGRGILTLYEEDDLLKTKLRLYGTTLSDQCKIGIYHMDKVYTANMINRQNVFHSSMVGEFDMSKDFYCAIIDPQNNNQIMLSGGTYAGYYFNDNSIFAPKSQAENDDTQTSQAEQDETEQSNTNFENAECEKDEVCSKCATCKYKEYFYSCNNLDEISTQQSSNFANETSSTQSFSTKTQNSQSNENISNNGPELQEETQSKTEMQSFVTCSNLDNEKPLQEIISNIISQFDNIFDKYEKDETLINLIPNSKFVKIDENNEQFSIGAIYDENDIKLICYAVFCNYNTPAPTELGEHYQWLPLDASDPLSDGYYIVFQDATDLKIVDV